MLLSRLFYVSISLVTSVACAANDLSNGLSPRSGNGYPPTLVINGGTFSSKWFESDPDMQIVELVIANTHTTNYLTLADTLTFSIESTYVKIVYSDKVYRIEPGGNIVIQLGVKNLPGITPGTTGSATFVLTYGAGYGTAITTKKTITGKCGFGDYTADTTSLAHHWNPDWFHQVKFGIFIHWGIYSAPAYGDVAPNEDYAEWYWKRQNDGPTYRTKTYQYHNETYGASFNYDDFFPNFTASAYNPKEWVDLFAAAGAQYMVPVTKHHDGFALFNISKGITERTSVNYGPKRDLIKELLDAAKKYHPEIRRGTYFSMPEWYHPGYKEYALTRGGGFPGGPPTNPYTGAEIPYTGYVPVDDFVVDLQLPEMKTLAYDYETEIMWCDIGGANNATIFASEWLNWARKQGRQVTFNDRCGIGGDFNTPEYYTNAGSVDAKWESNRGMDPFSFAFNYQTPDAEYLTGEDVVKSLVDIVSKNGNFLLDIGPRNDGSIPEIMSKGLIDAGAWIHAHGESIFSTRYHRTTPGLDPFRYTEKMNAFYIHLNEKPNATIIVPDRTPYLPGDTVTVVGGSLNGTVVNATWSSGLVTLHIDDSIIVADKYVWTFKINYTSTW